MLDRDAAARLEVEERDTGAGLEVLPEEVLTEAVVGEIEPLLRIELGRVEKDFQRHVRSPIAVSASAGWPAGAIARHTRSAVAGMASPPGGDANASSIAWMMAGGAAIVPISAPPLTPSGL